MSEDDFELIRGSGNVFRDLGMPDAEIRQAKAMLGAAILKTLDARAWTTRKAEEMTGVNHADFTRIRRANIGRFSMERLASILDKLDQDVTIIVEVQPKPGTPIAPPPNLL